MRASFKSFLHFARRQRYQLGLLAILLLLLLLLWHFTPIWFSPPEADTARQAAAQAAWQALQEEKRAALQPFDPNDASAAFLQSTGLDSALAARWQGYLAAGGHFQEPRDVLKIYGMDSLWWARARSFFQFTTPAEAPSKRNSENKKRPSTRLSLRPFKLNQISKNQLLQMGLRPYQAERILAFRERYRPFRSPDELREVYGLDSSLAQRLLPYAQVSSAGRQGRPSAKSDTAPEKNTTARININQADSLTLLKVRGIGPFTAGEILKRRRLWGGFFSLEQLRGIYSVDSTRYESLASQLICEGSYRRYPLNEVPYDTLIRWPMLKHRQAEAIISFRTRMRPYRSVKELLNIALIDTVLFRKIAPYLYVEASPTD